MVEKNTDQVKMKFDLIKKKKEKEKKRSNKINFLILKLNF